MLLVVNALSLVASLTYSCHIQVVPDLLRRGWLCKRTVTQALVEWHSWVPHGLHTVHEHLHAIANQDCDGGTNVLLFQLEFSLVTACLLLVGFCFGT